MESLVGSARRNFFTPIPSFDSFDALNVYLEEQCHKRRGDRLRGHKDTIGERLERDRQVLLPLSQVPYDACDKHTTRVTSLSLVRYRTNNYSVPVAYGHRDVLVRGYVHEVVISCGSEVIARHLRSYERDDFVFDPLHYLPLLEQKTGALDQAAPLVGWELPEEFAVLRRLLESRMGKGGKREFVQVLRSELEPTWKRITPDDGCAQWPLFHIRTPCRDFGKDGLDDGRVHRRQHRTVLQTAQSR